MDQDACEDKPEPNAIGPAASMAVVSEVAISDNSWSDDARTVELLRGVLDPPSHAQFNRSRSTESPQVNPHEQGPDVRSLVQDVEPNLLEPLATERGFPMQHPGHAFASLPTGSHDDESRASKSGASSPSSSAATIAPRASGARIRDSQARQWMEYYQELLRFREQNGHCNVPLYDEHENRSKLGQWVKRQRYQQRQLQKPGEKSSMTQERFEMLDSIGFKWEYYQDSWNQRLQQLQEFKAKHGHFKVSQVLRSEPSYRQLSVWVKHQRQNIHKYRRSGESPSMTHQRYEQLRLIGLVDEVPDIDDRDNRMSSPPARASYKTTGEDDCA